MISYTNHTSREAEQDDSTIPKQAREVFQIRPGDTLLLLGDEKRGIAIPAKGSFSDLFAAAFHEKEDEKA